MSGCGPPESPLNVSTGVISGRASPTLDTPTLARSSRARDLRRPEAIRLELLHPRRINGRLAAFVDAFHLGLGYPLELPLAAQVGLKLGEHTEHVEEALAGCRAGVDWLLSGLQDRAASPYPNETAPCGTAARAASQKPDGPALGSTLSA
jgi:hypothetical protein